MTLEIFPYIFSRYAGLTLERFNAMTFGHGDAYLRKWMDALESKKYSTTNLCNLLFELIQKEQDEGQRKLLLNLKRAIFNDRNGISALVQKLRKDLYEQTEANLLVFYESKANLSAFVANWEKVYTDAVAAGRYALKAISTAYAFQNGVLLSSKALYQELESFVTLSFADMDKREWRTEFSVLRYLTRMTYKTSPFSTLTYLGINTLSTAPVDSLFSPNVIVKSSLRLNNRLLKRLKGLMERHDAFNDLMYISLNSSVRMEDGNLKYLMNSSNIETFQKIRATPVNSFVYKLLSGEGTKEITLKSYCKQLSDQIDATPEELKAYLLKLVDAGLLELTLRCSEINPDWDIKLLDFLRPHVEGNSSRSLLFKLLKELQKGKNQFIQAGVAQRSKLLARMGHHLETTLSTLEKQAGFAKHSPEEIKAMTEKIMDRYRSGMGFQQLPYIPFDYRQESIFYEDTFTCEKGILPYADIKEFIGKLNALCIRLSVFDIRKTEREQLLDFFKKTYGFRSVVPVMVFYEAYYKDKNTSDQDFKGTAASETVQEPIWTKHLQEVLKHCARDSQGIYLVDKDLAALPLTDAHLHAGSAFVQLLKAPDGDRMQGVVNALMPGMGKISGRFLHLFDPEIAALQRDSNLSLLPGTIMMELSDGSSFNANIHPPLLAHEIKMPAANTQMEPSSQISIDSLSVTYTADDDKLVLLDNRSGKEICAFDLCLETLTNRSNLYQMLSHFNPVPYVSYRPIVHIVDQLYKRSQDATHIVVQPRITYEQDVVLRRKGWIIPKNLLPSQAVNESESIYYLKMKLWLQQNQLPEDVFLFLKSSYLPKGDQQEDRTTSDDYKPQYIDFNQPLLVKMFGRLIQRAGPHIYVEEVLPGVQSSGSAIKQVSEHLLQWHSKSDNGK